MTVLPDGDVWACDSREEHPRWSRATVSARAARRAVQAACVIAAGPIAGVVLSAHNYVRMIRGERR